MIGTVILNGQLFVIGGINYENQTLVQFYIDIIIAVALLETQ